ncbi:MAG: type IV toxin-antitoxin system AbiEi family antitoxin [Candidatus Limnocylindria bacterium]|nr:type IV toxin-antitoxin system AbiEi family antitoxin [Candidatus Limnocylindria bacterium]
MDGTHGITSPAELADALQAQGRYWATTDELARLTGQRGATLRASLARLIKQGRLFSPARGLYVVVPPEYRTWRVVPAEWFIDALMKHLGRSYYVGFLSAAALHGAAHQAPQTFRVVTDRWLEDRDIERVQLRFTVPAHVREMPVEQRTVPTGTFTVATRETTVVDLAWRPALGAGISNVATVIKEIGELDGEVLARIAPLRNRTTARRVGWLIERLRPDVDTHWLRVVARPEEGRPVLLVPGREVGTLDRTWGVRVNTKIESDV